MNLNITDIVQKQNMRANILIDHGRIHNGFLDSHGKKRIRIPSESFRIEEISPSADCLPQNKTEDTGIRHRKKIQLLLPRVDNTGKKSHQNASVDGKSALTNIRNFQKMLRIVVPFKNDIIDSRPDDAENNDPKGKILNIIRLVSAPDILFRCNKKSKQHPAANNHPVKRNGKPENTDVIYQVFDSNMQIRKIQIIILKRHGPASSLAKAFLYCSSKRRKSSSERIGMPSSCAFLFLLLPEFLSLLMR